MDLTLTPASDAERDAWDQEVLASPHGTVFHLWDWLTAVRDHTGTELCPLLVYRGTTLLALYPLFFSRRGPFRVAFSPPPGAFLLYLGPILRGYESMKQEKRESLFLSVQREVTRYIFQARRCSYARIRSVPGIPDSRPFRWTGYGVEPLYTYRLGLSGGRDSIRMGFDRKLRDSIRRAERQGVTVSRGEREDLRFILQSLGRRFSEQGIRVHDASQYLNQLMERFSPDRLRVYTAWFQGERAGGMVATAFKSGMALWIGVPRPSIQGIAPNDLVQWQAIQDALDEGYAYYELMDGGDNERLRFFKSKYNPDLAAWYSASKFSSPVLRLAVTLMRTGR